MCIHPCLWRSKSAASWIRWDISLRVLAPRAVMRSWLQTRLVFFFHLSLPAAPSSLAHLRYENDRCIVLSSYVVRSAALTDQSLAALEQTVGALAADHSAIDSLMRDVARSVSR